MFAVFLGQIKNIHFFVHTISYNENGKYSGFLRCWTWQWHCFCFYPTLIAHIFTRKTFIFISVVRTCNMIVWSNSPHLHCTRACLSHVNALILMHRLFAVQMDGW